HAHAAHQRGPLAAYQYLVPVRWRAAEAIGIANWQHRNAGGSRGDKRRAITDALTWRDLLYLRHLRLEGQCWAERWWQLYLVGGVKPIDGNAWPHQVKMGLRQCKGGCAICRMRQGGPQAMLPKGGQHVMEALDLAPCVGLIGSVGRGKVGKDALNDEARERVERLAVSDDSVDILGTQAQP